MTVLHTRMTWLLAALAAAGVAAGVFLWTRGDSDAPQRAAQPAASKAAAAARTAAPAAPPRPAPQQLANIEPSLAALLEPSASGDYDDNPMAEVLRRVLAADPQLAAFKYYHNRPLLDEADKVKYHALLSDPSTFSDVKQDLLFPEETKVDQAGNIKRLMKIDYLREALQWKENPMRETLLALVVELIMTDNLPADMPMDMRLSLSGNKLELYELLYEVAPERATALLQTSKGTRLEKLIAYFANTIQVRKRLEAQLETEVTL